MQSISLGKDISMMSRGSFKLATLFLTALLSNQPALSEQTTIVLPLHNLLLQSKNSSCDSKVANIVNPQTADNLATNQQQTAAAANSTTEIAQSKEEDDDDDNQVALKSINNSLTDTKTLKGRVIVPANPYRGVNNSSTPFAPEGSVRRALAAPLDPVFPCTEYVGIASQIQIGVPDLDPVFPLEKAIYKACPLLAKYRIKVYGWSNPGVNYSTSNKSNIPLSYAVVPRHLELDQQIFRVERVPDTVQNEHMDWGFRATMLYGIDYRWTTSEGWYPASNELLRHNQLYGLDPVELYTMLYLPKVAKGTVLKFGRFISPPDIEAQLAPDNYLWSHSLMFTYDCYTQTGLLASIKLSDSWMVQTGITAGADIAPWAKAAVPTGSLLLRWQSKSSKDMLYGGVNSINNGKFRMYGQHDNLQQFNLTWFHRFNQRFHIAAEGYFLYTIDALAGGTVNNGPPRPVNALTGPGVYLPGFTGAGGVVSYWNCKITDRDYIIVRPIDYLIDPRGWRTGFQGTYASWTAGWVHHFSDLLTLRPEIRYERAITNSSPYNNGTRRYQFTVGLDLIQRF